MFIDRHFEDRGLRYKNVHLGQVYLAENHQGVVDKVFREFLLTTEAAYSKWGDALPDAITSKLKTSPQQKFSFIHRVSANLDFDPERIDAEGMKYRSAYVSRQGNKLLEIGGYNSFPYAVSRYIQAERETYGRSPAMDVLASVKTLNEEKKTVLKQGQRAVDPIYLAHDNGILDTWGAMPGTINGGGVSAEGRPLVHALQPGNIAVGQELIQDERNTVNDSFFISLFQILTESPQKTATEVLELVREKGVLLTPTIGRQESEYLGYMAERELDLLSEQGLIEDMPPELIEAGGEYKMVYNTPMARARKAEEATGAMRALEFSMNMATNTQDMEWMDWFNKDQLVPFLSKVQGMPVSMINTLEKVTGMREARAEQQKMAQEAQMMPGQAALMKSAAIAGKELGAA